MQIIGPLTDPRAHGGDPADAFHVVAPSLPGFGFSTPVREVGWEISRTARAFAELMKRLGYERYGTQGGDIGSAVAGMLGGIDPDHVIGVHPNSDLLTAAAVVPIPAEDQSDTIAFSEADKATLKRLRQLHADGLGYIHLQSTRPQTLAYALNDLVHLPASLDRRKIQGVDRCGG